LGKTAKILITTNVGWGGREGMHAVSEGGYQTLPEVKGGRGTSPVYRETLENKRLAEVYKTSKTIKPPGSAIRIHWGGVFKGVKAQGENPLFQTNNFGCETRKQEPTTVL